MKRLAALIIFTLITEIIISQELNLGLEFAGGVSPGNASIAAMGPIIEYRLFKSVISINSGVIFHVNKNESLVTLPMGLKFNFGDQVRLCPTVGGFIRSNSNYGWSAGIIIDYPIKKGLFIFLKGEYNKDYWKDEFPTHNGPGEYTAKELSYWFGIGIKKNLL
jgi:hypothetical protein